MQTKCKKFVGGDHIEGGTVVNKEYPDVGVFVFQVGKGVLEGGRNGI